MGAARCRHRYLALSAVLAGRCPRCWSRRRRRPGRGGPGREAVPGSAPGPPRAPAPSPSPPPSAAPGPPPPPPRRGPGTRRRGLSSPSPLLRRGPRTVPAGRQRPGRGSERGGRSGGRVRGWKPVPEPPRRRRPAAGGCQSRHCRAPGSPVPAGLQPRPVPPSRRDPTSPAPGTGGASPPPLPPGPPRFPAVSRASPPLCRETLPQGRPARSADGTSGSGAVPPPSWAGSGAAAAAAAERVPPWEDAAGGAGGGGEGAGGGGGTRAERRRGGGGPRRAAPEAGAAAARVHLSPRPRAVPHRQRLPGRDQLRVRPGGRGPRRRLRLPGAAAGTRPHSLQHHGEAQGVRRPRDRAAPPSRVPGLPPLRPRVSWAQAPTSLAGPGVRCPRPLPP